MRKDELVKALVNQARRKPSGGRNGHGNGSADDLTIANGQNGQIAQFVDRPGTTQELRRESRQSTSSCGTNGSTAERVGK